MKCINCGGNTEEIGLKGCEFEMHPQVYASNNLPIVMIDKFGNHYEHEHSGHPTYMFPVTVDYIGNDPNRNKMVDGNGKEYCMDDDILESLNHESHALIYSDGVVAVTMYECCYGMWLVKNGKLVGGSLWDVKEWKLNLTEEQLKRIKVGK